MKITIHNDYFLDQAYITVVEALKEYYMNNPDSHIDEPHNDMPSLEFAEKLSRIAGIVYQPDMLNDNLITDITFDINHADAITTLLHPNYLPAIIHSHSFFEIIYVVKGTCTNAAGNQILELQEDDFLILAPNTDHAISVFNDETVVLNIMLKVSVFEKLFFRLFRQKDIMSRFFTKVLYEYRVNTFLLFHTGSDSHLKEAVFNLYTENKNPILHSEEIKVAYMSLIFTLLCNKYANSAIIYNDMVHDSNQNLAAILGYTQENYQTVTIKELSSKFNYSERHILRIFKNYTGNSFQKMLQKIRMQHASIMLAQSTASIESIALAVGYPSVQNFRVIFKREFGMSPNEYRKTTKQR